MTLQLKREIPKFLLCAFNQNSKLDKPMQGAPQYVVSVSSCGNGLLHPPPLGRWQRLGYLVLSWCQHQARGPSPLRENQLPPAIRRPKVTFPKGVYFSQS